MKYTPEEWNALSMSEQTEAWQHMSEQERRAVHALERNRNQVSANPRKGNRDSLRLLRAETCYGALRTVVDISFGLVIALLALMAIGGVLSPQMNSAIVLAVLGIAGGMMVAARQAILLLVDIADAQIKQIANSRRE